MILGRFIKQPIEREAYAIEYEDDLADGDTINADPPPLVEIVRTGVGTDASPLMQDALDVTGTRVTVWLSAGMNGSSYKITVTVATASGRVLQDEFIVKIKDY